MRYLPLILLLALGYEQEQKQSDITPQKIGETNGVALWKIEDVTLGGLRYIYFATPSNPNQPYGANYTYWQQGKQGTQYIQVPGMFFNGEPFFLEKKTQE
jgi:hypothetical protein